MNIYSKIHGILALLRRLYLHYQNDNADRSRISIDLSNVICNLETAVSSIQHARVMINDVIVDVTVNQKTLEVYGHTLYSHVKPGYTLHYPNGDEIKKTDKVDLAEHCEFSIKKTV